MSLFERRVQKLKQDIIVGAGCQIEGNGPVMLRPDRFRNSAAPFVYVVLLGGANPEAYVKNLSGLVA